MANSSRGDPNATRSIIIPKGVLDPNQVNIINIPRQLNTTAPLLVTPRREGGGLRARSLPVWNDELDSSFKDTSRRGNGGSYLSSLYDSSIGVEDHSFIPAMKIGKYNVIENMTASQERLWPKLPEHRMDKGFMPRHMSTIQEGFQEGLSHDTSFPSTMYSERSTGADFSYSPDFTISSAATDKRDCGCLSGEEGDATYNTTQNATFARSSAPSATFNQWPASRASFTADANSTFNRSQNATFNAPRITNENFNRSQQPYATSNLVRNTDATFDVPRDPYATELRNADGTFYVPENTNVFESQDTNETILYDHPPRDFDEYPDGPCSDDKGFSGYSGAQRTPTGAGHESDASRTFYQTCDQVPDPYSPKIIHMSSKTFSQVNDNPPQSRSMTVDAPEGIDESVLKYATQIATMGDSTMGDSRMPAQTSMSTTRDPTDLYHSPYPTRTLSGQPTSGQKMESAQRMATFGETPECCCGKAFQPSMSTTRNPPDWYYPPHPTSTSSGQPTRRRGMEWAQPSMGTPGNPSDWYYPPYPTSTSSGRYHQPASSRGLGLGMESTQVMDSFNFPGEEECPCNRTG
ncbi:hypothetical protein JTB14_015898 [Gonioctena quinquepunctata]|nr:hypothetical protein JTB14_015898 [Gonioctena quinquepunctata]